MEFKFQCPHCCLGLSSDRALPGHIKSKHIPDNDKGEQAKIKSVHYNPLPFTRDLKDNYVTYCPCENNDDFHKLVTFSVSTQF